MQVPSNIQSYLWLEIKVISTEEGDYLLGVKIRVQQFSNMIIKFTLTVIIIIADGRGAGYIDLDFKRTLK